MTTLEPRVFQRNEAILLEINETNWTQMHILYQPVAVPSQLNPVDATFNGFLQDLRIQVDINSLPEVGLASLEPELTQAERFTAYTEIEWNNPRVEMQILKSLDGVTWIETARLSLQNRQPYYGLDLLPYFTRQSDALLGKKWIAVRFLPIDGSAFLAGDRLAIDGDFQLQAHHFVASDGSSGGSTGNALPTPLNVANSGSLVLTTTSQLVLPANPQRKGLVMTLVSGGGVYLRLGQPAVLAQGIYLAGIGASLTFDFNNLWVGEVHGINTNATARRVVWTEFV